MKLLTYYKTTVDSESTEDKQRKSETEEAKNVKNSVKIENKWNKVIWRNICAYACDFYSRMRMFFAFCVPTIRWDFMFICLHSITTLCSLADNQHCCYCCCCLLPLFSVCCLLAPFDLDLDVDRDGDCSLLVARTMPVQKCKLQLEWDKRMTEWMIGIASERPSELFEGIWSEVSLINSKRLAWLSSYPPYAIIYAN